MDLGNFKNRAFAGRVIFDHLAKTAGQSVNDALRTRLGAGCVTENLIGEHRSLIRQYGGDYSIISGHLSFENHNRGLDPRYDYVTCIRHPIDRCLSYVYFILNNHTERDLSGLYQHAEMFLVSNGEIIHDELRGSLSNYYTHHFSSACESASKNISAVDMAYEVLTQYSVIGLYEDLPNFLSDFSALLKFSSPLTVNRLNTTNNRPSVDEDSRILRSNLEELNRLDLEFYERAKALIANRKGAAEVNLPDAPVEWVPYNRRADVNSRVDGFMLISSTVSNPTPKAGDRIKFVVDFSLDQPLEGLELGIHIFDQWARWAFGCNSTMLECSPKNVESGCHRITYTLPADLPAGQYQAGFAFTESGVGIHRPLAWFENTIQFSVIENRTTPGIGYASLPLEIKSAQVSSACLHGGESIYQCDRVHFSSLVGKKTSEGIFSDGTEGFLLFGPYLQMEAGEYEISFIGECQGELDGLWVDCIGRECLPEGTEGPEVQFGPCEITPCSPGLPLASLLIQLKHDVANFETRFYVNASATVHLRYVIIRRRGFRGVTPLSKSSYDPSLPISLSIRVSNPTTRDWVAVGDDRIRIACHWLDEKWNMVDFDSRRFSLPECGIEAQHAEDVEVSLTTPERPGVHHLMATLVEGEDRWLHESGEFIPQVFTIEIKA